MKERVKFNLTFRNFSNIKLLDHSGEVHVGKFSYWIMLWIMLHKKFNFSLSLNIKFKENTLYKK